MLEKVFRLSKHNATVKTEIIAGITTFMTMAYILAVNPAILSDCGMDFGKVFAATAIASALASFLMGLTANLPFALSAGMGLNAMFSYTVCIGMGYSFQWALSAVFCEGVIFIILTITNIREAIITSIPQNLKKAIGAGVGLFIAYIGLKNAQIIVADPSNLTTLSSTWYKGPAGVAIAGIIITGILLSLNLNGALLYGMAITTIIGIPFGVTTYAGGRFFPDAPYFCEFAFSDIFSNGKSTLDFFTIVFTFLYIDMFDTVGTLIACAGKSGIIREDGSIPMAKKALMSDAIGTTAGAILGTSTITTFVESSAGVAVGGRTGLTAVTTGIMFIISMFLAPLFGSIPSAATAPALIIVGVMMVSSVKEIDFDDLTEAIPAFLTIITMICASSISTGIMFGVMSYTVIKMLSGKFKELHVTTYIVAALFLIKIILDIVK